MRTLLGTLCLLSLLLSSCGDSKKKNNPSVEPLILFSHPDGVKAGDIYCQGPCPDYVGAMFLSHNPRPVSGGTYYDVKFCSVTLIAPNKVVTNRHCIEGIIGPGQKCHDKARIEIKFPANKLHQTETVECDRIISASPSLGRRLAPDTAVIRLKYNLQRKPAPLLTDRSQKSRPVQLYPAYFDKSFSPAVVAIWPVRCQQVVHREENIFSFDESGPLLTMENCRGGPTFADQSQGPLTNGNSGSGIFTLEDGAFIGLHSSSSRKHKDNKTTKQEHGTASHCVPGLESEEHSCFYSSDASYIRAAQQISFMNFSRERVEPLLSSYDWDQHSAFRWKKGMFLEKKKKQALKRRLKLKLKPEWDLVQRYLFGQDDRLHEKYIRSIRNLHFPKRPKCLKKKELKENMKFPVLYINWGANNQPWLDAGIGTKGPGLASVLDWTLIYPQVYEVSLKLTSKTNKRAIFQGQELEQLAPIQSFQLTVPFCGAN